MQEGNPQIVLAGILIYMAGMLAVGFWSSRKVKNMSDFLVAGRNLPFFLALATMFATWFGAGTCMGAAGEAYSRGILGVIADPFAAGVSLIIAGLFYVALLRRMELLTITEIFGRRYSKNSEIAASALMVPAYIGWLGSQIVALGYILNVFAGIDPAWGMVLGAGILLIYTYAGGMWAVTLTDFIQVVILVIGLGVLYPAVLEKAGGFQNVLDAIPRHFWRFVPQNADYHDWTAYAGQWLLLGLGCVVGQDLVQRSLSSKNESVARHSAIWAGILYITLGMIPVLIGLAGRVLMPEIDNPEHIIPRLALQILPPFFLIVFLGALVSAIMSSADSALLAATSLITNNILYRLWPSLNDQALLRLTRLVTVMVGTFSLAVALYVQQIYDLMVNSWATLLVAIFVPVSAALFWKKANTPAAWTSMISGTAVWLIYLWAASAGWQDLSEAVFYQGAAYGGFASLAGYLIATAVMEKLLPGAVFSNRRGAGTFQQT